MNKKLSTYYLIIGSGTAAANAIDSIRKNDTHNTITVITDEKIPFYSRPLITRILSDPDTPIAKILYRDQHWLKQNKVQLYTATKAVSLNTSAKTLRTTDGEIKYSKLLIATGGEPIIPPFLKSKPNAFTLTNLENAQNLSVALRKFSAQGKKTKVVIIGAGFIGLKAAEAIISSGINTEVTIVELAPRVLPAMLDETASEIFARHLTKNGIRIILNESAENISTDGKNLILKSGKQLPTDIIISAIGVKPSLSFVLSDKKIKTNRGILADKFMKTAATDVWVAGDVAEHLNILTEQKQPIPIWPLASRQGATAGANMSSPDGKSAFYSGGFPMNSVEVFGLPVISAGLTNPSPQQIESEQIFILQKTSSDGLQYKKLIFHKPDKTLHGYILIGSNAIERAGIYTELIKLKHPIQQPFEDLLDDKFGFISVAKDNTWKKRITPLEA